MELSRLIRVARGDEPADLLLANAAIVNVFSRDIDHGSVAIAGDTIAGIGDYAAKRVVDLNGRFLAPGFIDPHVHIESALASVSEFVRAVLPSGTTSVVADPHEIANVLGIAGIDYMLAAAMNQPMQVFYTLSSCVPATTMETAGARISAGDLRPFFDHPRVAALAEMMNFPGVIGADPDVLDKIRLAKQSGKPLDGHAPGLSGKPLQAYLASGIASDHECTTVEEAREKLAAGMHIMIRQGTGARNLHDLLPLVTESTCHRLMWCTDDRHPHDLVDSGHVDAIVREAVASGVDPVMAIQMGTLNPAGYFGLRDAGAVAPGRRADLVVLSDLERLNVEQVFSAGLPVAENGVMGHGVGKPAAVSVPSAMAISIDRIDFSVPARAGRLRVIGLVPEQIVTRTLVTDARIESGRVAADVSRDILKLAVVERYSGDCGTGVGFVNGFGLQRGALASSVAHDSHNIIVVGVGDADMRAAVAAVADMNGGLVAVADGTIWASLPLPIAGLMVDAPIDDIRSHLDRLSAAARYMGATVADPFMALSFLALPVIPELKLTDKGLVDVAAFSIVSLFE